jgi:stage II sporulation protein D
VPYLKSVDDPYSLGQPSATWTKSYTPAQIDTLLKSKSINIGPIIGIYVTKVSPNGRALETVFVGRDGDYVTSKEKARFMLGTYDIRSTWYTINSGSGSGLAVESGSSVNTLPQTGFVIESASGQSTFTSTAQLTVQSASGVTTAMPAITDQIVFTGYGFGHGIGMSQWGAKKMAELGMDYTKILTHYYKNTIVK